MMGKFRKRPVEIEAVLFSEIINGIAVFGGDYPPPEWLTEAMNKPKGDEGAMFTSPSPGGHKLHIYTLEGLHTADPGDWIIQGVKGEIYPCKPNIFAMTYEPVE